MKYLFLISLLCFNINSFSQTLQQRIAASFDTLAELYPIEKAFLHTDRDAYQAGETVWLKSYVSLESKPSYLSKVIYVELVNEQNILVEKKMYKLENGAASGDINLKPSLPAGTYVINAYTMWMLNFPGRVYSKHIYVYNTDIKKASSSGRINMNFFPEGGKMIEGLNSIIAVKATGENGMPVAASGKILDSKKNAIASFSAGTDGLGSFSFATKEGESYVAVSNGDATIYPLPKPEREGVNLLVTNKGGPKIFINVQRSELNKAMYNELVIAAILHGKLAYIANLNIDEGLDAVSIPRKNFPPGIMELLVFNKNGKALASRLVFINNSVANEDMQSRLQIIRSGAANEIGLNIPDSKKCELSAAILQSQPTLDFTGENILSGLLLSNDINGYVHNAGRYFTDTSMAMLRSLDLLMLTSKPNSYDYSQILNHRYPGLNYIVESGISISGRALKPSSNIPIKAGKINIWLKGEDSTSILSEATLNESGQFYIPNLDFRKSAKILYQGTSGKKETALVEVKINPTYFDTLKSAHARPLVDLNPYLQHDISNRESINAMINDMMRSDSKAGVVLQEIKLSGKKKSVADSLNSVYVTDLFVLSDQTFMPDSNTMYSDIWQLLRSRLSGLLVNKTDTGTMVNFGRYAGLNQFGMDDGTSIQFFLNEIPVTVDMIEYLNPSDIALIKSYPGASGIVLGAARGAIAIYTHKGKSLRDWRAKGFDVVQQSGYSVERKFVALQNDSLPTPASNTMRNTLFWDPKLQPKSNKQFIKFYNEKPGFKIRVVVQGFDEEGKLFFGEGEY